MKKSGASFQTPKQTKATLAIQSEQNRDAKKNKNKRKSLPANLANGDGDTSPKKPKIDAFSGTTDLFMQMNKSPEGKAVKKAENEKSPGKQNKKPQKQNENASKSEKALGERAKRRKERLIARRVAGKERLKQTLGQVSTGDETAITQLKEHLTQLLQKPGLSKSGKRKIKQLKKALKVAGVDVSGFVISQQNKEVKAATQKPQAANQKKQQKPNAGKKDSAAPTKKNVQQTQKKQVAAKEEEEDSDEDEESDSGEDNVTALMSALKKDEVESDEDEDDDDSDTDQDDSLMQAEAEEDESDEDEDDEDDDDEEEDSDENDEVPDKKTKLGKKNQSKVNQNKDTVSSLVKGKSRYVLFVGNLPFDVTKEEISQHFAKIGKIRDIRIPLEKQTNKCRGFAYVELLDQTTYEKALSMHHTTLKGRRINVQYSQGGKKKGEEKKKEIKAKNFKLQAMRHEGKLSGSVKQSQKRAARREKRKSANKAN